MPIRCFATSNRLMRIHFVGFLFSKKKLTFTLEYSKLLEKTHKYFPLLSTWSQQVKWQQFHKEYPGLTEHTKPYKSPTELLNKLMGEGLHIPNQLLAENIIYTHNYFRLKAYFIPLMEENGKFKPNTTFNTIYDLYLADQKIRDFLFPIIALLEIRIRAVIDNEITRSTSDPFWHLNPENFKKFDNIKKVLDKAGQRFTTGQQEFALHHMSKYYTLKSFDYKRLPPFWVISEIFTIEHLLTVANNIDRTKFACSGGNTLNNCAVKFGFTSYDSLMTNLKCILAIRNISAHHSRIWNRNLQAPSTITKHILIKPPTKKNNRLYNNLVMLRIMCKQQGINDGIGEFFADLIANQPTLDKQRQSMGFPEFWETDPIWK